MQRAKRRRSPLRQYSWRRRFESSPLRCKSLDTERDRGVEDMKLRFDEVLYDLEQERQRVDEDLRRFAVAAAYLRTLLLPPGVAAGHNHGGAAPSALADFLTRIEAQPSLRQKKHSSSPTRVTTVSTATMKKMRPLPYYWGTVARMRAGSSGG